MKRLNRTRIRREIRSGKQQVRPRSRWQTGGPAGSPVGCVNHEGWSHLEIVTLETHTRNQKIDQHVAASSQC